MRKLIYLAFLLVLALTACGPQSVPQNLPTAPPTDEPRVLTPTPVIEAEPAETLVEEVTEIEYNDDIFKSVDNCRPCHENMMDADGNNVSNIGDWSTAMMAHAAVDPYYRATVTAEVARHPEYAAAIEDKCATCHMPMAHFFAHANGGTSAINGENGYANPESSFHKAAMEAISCTVCHQIQNGNYGQESSFSGGLTFDTSAPVGERVLFGPYPAEEPYTGIMQAGSGYINTQTDHMAQSELCATCHTLHTNYVTANGTLSENTFPEQTAYLEWLASDYANEKSCQDCHMPKVGSEVTVSNLGSPPRSPFYRHTFIGGNAHMLGILRDFSDEIDVQTDEAGFNAAIQRTQDFLGQLTATLSIDSVSIEENQLDVDVSLVSLVGHKFPTGFPSRRAWIHLTVVDAAGNTIFESGAYEENGAIIGNANDEDETLYEPHYTEITAADQVQIYENIMHDVEGNVTTALLRAATNVKDNRLLPSGFDRETVDSDIATYGAAADDADFTGAGDTVHYAIQLDGTSGPLTVKVELLYQSIGFRWAKNLGQENSSDIDNFLRYYNETPNIPVVITSDEITVQ